MNDRQLLQLISMAQEAQALADAAGRSPSKVGGAGEDVIARIGPERLAAEAQLEAARARLAELELARTRWRSQRWRTPAAAAVAAGVVATVMLWPAGQPAFTPTPGGSGPARMGGAMGHAAGVTGDERGDLALAAGDGARGVGGTDFERPLSNEPAPGFGRGGGGLGDRGGWAETVLVVHRDAAGECDCDRIDVRQWTQALLASNPGTQIVYAREGGPAGAGESALTPMDFTCFQQRFLAGDGRGVASAASCAAATMPPALSVSDFVCFTRKLAGGCL